MSTFLNAHNGWKDRNDKMLFRSNQIWFLQRDCIRQKYLRNKNVLWRSQFSKNKIPHVPKRMYWIETIICCYFFWFSFSCYKYVFLVLFQRWWWWWGRLVYCVLLCGLSSCLLFLSPHPPVYKCPLALYHLNHHHLHHHHHHHHHYNHSIIIIFITVVVVIGKEQWWHYLFWSALCLHTSC